MSLVRFQLLYDTGDQCHEALVKLRWPDSFVCPRCAERRHSFCKPKPVFQCSSRRLQASVKADIFFHKSRTRLIKWFCTIYFMATARNDVVALELMRNLDVIWSCLKGWKGFAETRFEHPYKATGGGRPRDSKFKRVNILLSNMQFVIIGTCRSCDSQHLPLYMAAHEWRFNWRFESGENTDHLVRAALATKPAPYREIIAI